MSTPTLHLDRHGAPIQVGDRVRLLTGRHTGEAAIVRGVKNSDLFTVRPGESSPQAEWAQWISCEEVETVK